ncbi:hypothetical protein F5X99DRAFT_424682 [Biscogniauxia marginata]|nr:hypothetical protein F5X99DRAFT_424682 [Biscogniauxia marginata]
MSNANNHSAPPFFWAPLEVREMIYSYVLGKNHPIMIRHTREAHWTVPADMRGKLLRLDNDSFEDRSTVERLNAMGTSGRPAVADAGDDRGHTALLRVNSTFYSEAQPVLFRANRLVIDDLEHGRRWAQALMPRSQQLVREVSLWVPRRDYANEMWTNCVFAIHVWSTQRLTIKVFVQTPSTERDVGEWRKANLDMIQLLVSARPDKNRNVQIGFFDSLDEAIHE